VYALIARLYLIVQVPVALSRSDIQRYDPALKEGAVKRALDRLIGAGWLAEEPGHKRRYVPTWGRSRAGVARPWRIGPRLGCPTHIFTTRLDKAILDTYMGKLTPHSRLPASIERYLSAPLLGLRDVGAYVLTTTGQPLAATAALYRWQLVCDGQPQPIPATEQALALASQRQQVDDGAAQLLPAGWARLGVPVGQGTHPAQPSPYAQPLFFAPKALIGDLIPRLIDDSIGCSSSHEVSCTPLEGKKTGLMIDTTTMPGNLGIYREISEPPPAQQLQIQRGGGSDSSKEKRTNGSAHVPDTASAKLLLAINAHPTSIAELAELPADLVMQAIAYAKVAPGIESIPGWVVDALRRHRDERWPIPQIRSKHYDERINAQEVLSGAYGDLFRLGSDLADLDDFAPDRERVQPDVQIDIQEQGSGYVQPGALPDPVSSASGPGKQPPAPNNPQPQLDLNRSAEDLTRLVREDLVMRCERSQHKIIRRLQVQVIDDRTVVRCASPADRIVVMSTLMGVLRWVIADLGLPADIRVTDGAGSDY
jgi:hypothetical protein